MKIILQLLIFTGLLYPQAFLRELSSIPFDDSQGNIPNIFSGGTNNLEPQFVDIDNDGDLDIFYLDSDGTFGWYKNTGTPETPDFELSFDNIPGLFLNDWFYFADIDNDNDYDLFTGTSGAFILFLRNTGTPTLPYFTIEQDTLNDDEGNPIYSEFGCNPVFADIDGDNDFDLISGNSVGTLNFYENIGTPEKFNLKFITNEWQGIIIISGDFPVSSRHGASSLDFVDIDADDDLDLFWGDFFGRSLYFIENQGTRFEPDMHVVSNRYPQNQDSIYTSGFNMPRFTDIDNDGDYDLFVTVLYDPTVPQSLMYYRNQGNPVLNDFHKITEDYLKTLDVGNDSAPVFVDIDNDGDKDLFIGSTKNPDGTLYYFENIGSPTNPSFLLVDSAYSGIESELSIFPAFSDIDNDGDYDLLLGNFNGSISLFLNNGTPYSPDFSYSGLLTDIDGDPIDVGVYARPFLIDYDNDNDPDLSIGAFNGKFYFYKNVGTAENYTFISDSTFIHRMNPSDPNSPVIDVGDNSSPFFIDYDDDGDIDFFTGNRNGFIYFFRNDGTNVQPLWTIVTNNFLGQDFGADTEPYFIDVDSDTDIDLFIGNLRGGLYFYRNQAVTNIHTIKKDNTYFVVNAYPNPFNSEILINLNTPIIDSYLINIFDISGRLIKTIFSGELTGGNYKFKWNGKNNSGTTAASGIYFVETRGSKMMKTLKIILLK